MNNPIWYRGQICEASETPEAGPFLSGPGVVTTARVRAGQPTLERHHLQRLDRDARHLGLPDVRPDHVRSLMRDLAATAFSGSHGVLRILLSSHLTDAFPVVASVRPWADDRGFWTARTAPFAHPGPGSFPGAKLADRPIWREARKWALENHCDETLLINPAGHLVEGARTNLIVVDEAGLIQYPDPDLGAVAGIGLAVLRQAGTELTPALLQEIDLQQAREIIAVNAVRGPRPVTFLNGRPVGSGTPGRVAQQLHNSFESVVQEESRSRR